MRKLTALALALLMLTGMTSAVATETVDISEPMDIEIMAYFVMDVTNEDPIIRYLSEKFNVNFKFTITNIDNYDDTLNMRIVSGDVPDWFRIRDTAQSVYTQLQQDGMLLNVSALVEKYGFENIRATFALPNAGALATDGVFYRVPDTLGKLCRGVYYRQDWLEELGLKMPANFDDLHDALKAMVNADPDGKGTTGLTGYNLWCLEGFAPSFTGYNTWGQKADGELIYWYEDDQYRDFLKFWNTLYEEKLLDNEIFINSYETCMEKLATGRAGFYIMNMNTTWWSNNKTMLASYDATAKLGNMIPLPEGPAGAYAATFFGFSADSAFSADMSEAKAAHILAIMDYLLSDEGRELTLYGNKEGVYYDLVDGKKVQKEDAVNADWGQTLHFMGELADFGTNDRLASENEVVDWYAYVADGKNGRSDKLAYFSNDECAGYKAEIDEVVTRYVTAFITGEMDIDAHWDEFQEAMERAGLSIYKGYLKEYVEAQEIELDYAME